MALLCVFLRPGVTVKMKHAFSPKSRLRAVNGSIEGNEICLKSWHHGNHWESKGNYPQNGPPDPGNKALIGGGGIGRVLNSYGIN